MIDAVCQHIDYCCCICAIALRKRKVWWSLTTQSYGCDRLANQLRRRAIFDQYEEDQQRKVSIHRYTGCPVGVLVEVGVERDEYAEWRMLSLVGRRLVEKALAKEFVCHCEVVECKKYRSFKARPANVSESKVVFLLIADCLLFLEEFALLIFRQDGCCRFCACQGSQSDVRKRAAQAPTCRRVVLHCHIAVAEQC